MDRIQKSGTDKNSWAWAKFWLVIIVGFLLQALLVIAFLKTEQIRKFDFHLQFMIQACRSLIAYRFSTPSRIPSSPYSCHWHTSPQPPDQHSADPNVHLHLVPSPPCDCVHSEVAACVTLSNERLSSDLQDVLKVRG
ncbi:hypothetical protein L208DRAFT_136520 [Tricholoma matsutake]|nr:hypothetical protein L208DRAFT_136520 [Tricholoma matsutake 945]